MLQIPTYTAYGNTALLGPSAGNFQAVTDYLSDVNSSYNAMVVEFQNRSLHSLRFDVNYTWAHSLDFSQNASTAGNTMAWYDPYSNPRINYGNSSWDIKNRLVAYAVYSFPNFHVNPNAQVPDRRLEDRHQLPDAIWPALHCQHQWVCRYCRLTERRGRPYVHSAAWLRQLLPAQNYCRRHAPAKGPGGSGALSPATDGTVFNVANHQNVSAVSSTEYKLSDSTLTYQNAFGQVTKTNNSGFSYTPRQIEIAMRLNF